MKRFHKVIAALVAAVVLGATALGLVGCSKKPTIAIITKGETHAFWQSVKAGAEAAGKEYGYKVTFRGATAESEEYVSQQREMINSAIGNKSTKALVLATVGAGFTDELKAAYDKNLPVVQFDSGIYNKGDITADKNPIVSSVATSNVKAAELAAEKFYPAIKDAIAAATTTSKYVLGIIRHDNSPTGIDRANGFETKIKALAEADGNGEKLSIVRQEKENKPGDYKAALQSLQQAGAKAIFMTNEGVVNEVYPEVSDNKSTYKDIIFCGFDAGTNQINWMKSTDTAMAKLYVSVAQDSYQIGYQAVEQAALAIKKANGESAEVTAQVDLSGKWWDASNVDQMIADNIVYEG